MLEVVDGKAEEEATDVTMVVRIVVEGVAMVVAVGMAHAVEGSVADAVVGAEGSGMVVVVAASEDDQGAAGIVTPTHRCVRWQCHHRPRLWTTARRW